MPNSGDYNFYSDGKPEMLFCDNETNVRRLYGQNDAAGYFKDAFHEYVVHGNSAAVNPRFPAGTNSPRVLEHGLSPLRRRAQSRSRLRLVEAD